MKKIYYYILFSSLVVSGCIRYNPPPINQPKAEEWKTSQDISEELYPCPEPEQVIAEASFRPWWKIFKDEQLETYEYQAIKESPTVQAAVARLEAAIAFYGIERSALFPEITLEALAQRQRISQSQTFAGGSSSSSNTTTNSASPTGGSLVAKGGPPMLPIDHPSPSTPIPTVPAPPPPMCSCPPTSTAATPTPITHVTTLQVLPTLTYQLDVWGQNYQAMQAALMQVKAEQEDLQNVLLQLTTSVANFYLQVLTFDAELAIVESTIKTREQNYKLNQDQYEAGLIDDLAVEQAKSDLENVLADYYNTKRLRALAEDQLATLVGQPASTFDVPPSKELPILPEIPAGVPSQTLTRRPDIRQAQFLIDSAVYNVGVQKTMYFPTFDITLDYGYISSKASQLFKWKSHVWLAAIESITPIFTAGRIGDQIDQAVAEYKQSVQSYLNIVLTAFQQVEDSLYSIDATKKELYHLHLDVVASQKAYDIADTRYRMGLENYILVVNTERTLFDVQRTEIQIQREQYTNTVNLINSLGGYWELSGS